MARSGSLVASALFGLALVCGCASAPTAVPTGDGGGGQPAVDLGPPTFDATPLGWAAVEGEGVVTTTGGEGGPVVEVSTLADFAAQAKAAGPSIIYVSGVIGDGTRVSVTSHHTIIGRTGAEFHGGLKLSGAVNVIIRNLKIVGNNCADSPSDCSGGADAVSIGSSSHHVWVDHCDISDGSDGNLDVNDGSDFVTISWTKFSYSGSRPGAHQFSNLVGSSDSSAGDAGHLRVTYHHDWWAERVKERMPRVRYGQVHLFNNYYSARGDNYCIGVGVFANVLTEANVFYGVNDPIESASYSNAESVVVSRDNLYLNVSGQRMDRGLHVFTPPYPYATDAARDVQAKVQNWAGPCAARFGFDPGTLTCAATEPGAVTMP